jgi:hypothetical protein
MASSTPIDALMGGGDPPSSGLSLKDHMMVRDALTGIVGKQAKDLKDQDLKDTYKYLQGMLGQQTAQKLLTHTMAFNQRSDMQGTTPEKRVQAFYDMGSQDPELNTLITKAKMLGSGPLGGFNTSPDKLTMIAGGRDFTQNLPNGNANTTGMQANTDRIK